MDTQYLSPGSLALKRVRLVGLLFAVFAGLAAALLTSTSPAYAESTDGGSGQGSGTGGDGCTKSGWRLVDDVDDIIWQDDGVGRECGNTAWGSRNNSGNVDFSFNSSDGTARRCSWTNPGIRQACPGGNVTNAATSTSIYSSDNSSLYFELAQMGAGGCYRRSDVRGIWYLQDAGLEPGSKRSWTNLGQAPVYPRSVGALESALRDGPELVDAGNKGDNAWWDRKLREADPEFYDLLTQDFNIPGGTTRNILRGEIADSIPRVAGTNPVIFCWYGSTAQLGITCGDIFTDQQWSDFLHPAGVTKGDPATANCFSRCPTARGQYPTAPPRAGQLIPNANSGRNPRPASNSENDIANYCYPPITATWHQGEYGSNIPGIGWALEDTTGGSNNADVNQAWPYAYITALEDGNAAYNSATKKGNAPGQGQFPGRSVVKKSSFGTFWDNYCASGAGGNFSCDTDYIGDPGNAQYNNFKAAYNAAIAAVPNDTHAVTDLTGAEKEAVAKGRILNVAEYITYATAEGRKYRNRFYTRVVNRAIYYNMSGNERSNATTYGGWTYDTTAHPTWNNEAVPADQAGVFRPTFSDGTTFANTHPDQLSISTDLAVYGATPKPSALWQNAVNHCNNQEFGPLNPAGTANNPNETGVIDTGDASQYYSASAVDKLADSQWRVNQNINLANARWGQSAAGGNSPSNKAGFFDRVCYYPGAAKNPTNMADMTAAAPASYTFFRDNVQYKVEGKNNGDSPFFVPDFRGEDRTTTVTNVIGYKADRSTRTSADSWTVSFYQTQQTSATYVNGTPNYYYGYWADAWTCNIGRNRSNCNAPTTNSTCGHQNPLQSGNWGWETTNRNGQQGYNDGGCKLRTYYLTNISYGTPGYWSYTYGWGPMQTATYSTDAAAQAGYNWCISAQSAGDPGRTTGCTKTAYPATWSPVTNVSVPSCPMSDTATERYTNCVPVTQTTSTTTNYNVVDYQNEDPTQIIVTRDQLGTPKADLVKMQGLANDGAKTELFSTNPDDVRTPKSEGIFQSQFAASPSFMSSTVAVNTGAWRRLQTQAAYASDKALPQVVTLAWYYTPRVKSTFAQTNVGYGRSGGLMTYTKGEGTSPVRGRVEATNGSLTSDDGMSLAQHQNQVWANTGTDIQDGLNVPLVYGTERAANAPFGWTGDPTVYSPHYYAIKFVRAVGE